MAWTICSKEDVEAIHGINSDSLQDIWSDWAESLIADHLGNDALLTPVTYTDELYSGDGGNTLFIRHPLITSVTSVSIGDELVSSTLIKYNTHGIMLSSMVFTKGVHNIKVTYTTSGSGNSAFTLKFACAAMISAMFDHYGRKGADSSVKFAIMTEDFGAPTANVYLGIISNLEEIMKQTLKRDYIRIV